MSPSSRRKHRCAQVAPTLPAPMKAIFLRAMGDLPDELPESDSYTNGSAYEAILSRRGHPFRAYSLNQCGHFSNCIMARFDPAELKELSFPSPQAPNALRTAQCCARTRG